MLSFGFVVVILIFIFEITVVCPLPHTDQNGRNQNLSHKEYELLCKKFLHYLGQLLCNHHKVDYRVHHLSLGNVIGLSLFKFSFFIKLTYKKETENLLSVSFSATFLIKCFIYASKLAFSHSG